MTFVSTQYMFFSMEMRYQPSVVIIVTSKFREFKIMKNLHKNVKLIYHNDITGILQIFFSTTTYQLNFWNQF